jgi:hypothetical protein
MQPRWISRALLVSLGLAAMGGAGCTNRFEAKVDGVLVAEADHNEELPPAPRVVIRAEPTVPDEEIQFPPGPVQLVIERSVPWARVEALLATLEAKKIEPILVVGQTHKLRRFRLNDELTGGPKFTITGDAKGKFCVQTAQLPQAYCVAGAGRHVHRAFVRETVRDVVKKWEMKEAEAFVDPATEWADVVRIVDGVRTCCGVGKGKGALVRVSREAPLGEDAEQGNPGAVRELEEAAKAEEAAEAAGQAGTTAPAPTATTPTAAPPAPATPTAPAPAAPARPAPAAPSPAR